MTAETPAKEQFLNLEETLQLRCPGCNGGLNLRRKHLGITGKCVHCQVSLTAIEEFGSVKVVTDPASVVSRGSGTKPVTAEGPKLEVPDSAPHWAFPAREPEAGKPDLVSTPPHPDLSLEKAAFIDSSRVDEVSSDFAFPLAGRGSENLFADRAEVPLALSQAPSEAPAPSLFDEDCFQKPFSSFFKEEEKPLVINESWGTKVPQESHASISPFATPPTGGGGFAETLFRDKVVKETSSDDFTIAIPFSVAKAMEAPAPARHQDCAPKVILDGDGRPMAPMTKEEEEEFAKNFFAMERARGKQPKWRKRLIRFLTMVIIVGFAGIVAFFLTPKEKLAEIKTKTVTWLEPGMAILDYLPEGMRPDWLPKTDFGIDSGLDENGNPKPKMNAFEGLDKLKVDIGKMRGAADDELKKLNEF